MDDKIVTILGKGVEMHRVLSRAAAILAVVTGVTLGASTLPAQAAPAPHSTRTTTTQTGTSAPARPVPIKTTGGTYSQQDWWW
jgi:hypothetical protein